MASSIDVAAAFVEISEGRLSHLALQKYVYLAHMFYAGVNGGACLVDDSPFQAWDYGPVSPTLYRVLRGFGSAPVPRAMLRGACPLDEGAKDAVQQVWKALSESSAARLVQITHDPRGAWAKSYKPGVRGIVISQEDIVDEYRQRASRK